MSSEPPTVFTFDDFRLDTDGPALYHRDRLIDGGGKKMLEVLAVFLRKPNSLVSYNELIDSVWGEGNSRISSDNLNQYVRQIRKVLSTYEPDRVYFSNKKGRGYEFTADVETVTPVIEDPGSGAHPVSTDIHYQSPATVPAAGRSTYGFGRSGVIFAVFALLLIGSFGFWMYASPNDDEEIRRIVKESQVYESLVLYKEPQEFREENLDQYWTPDLDLTANYDRRRIRESVKNLIRESRKYGDGTKCVRLDFQSVEISKDKSLATVRTLEEWFLAVYNADGTPLRNRTVGPYFVDYILKKHDGRWLIEKSTSASVIRPRPQLAHVNSPGQVEAGKEFRIDITGQDIEPQSVLVEIVGPGCPEVKPCRISNEILRTHAKVSAISLTSVPLTLASGEFQVFLYNADSQPSVPAILTVP